MITQAVVAQLFINVRLQLLNYLIDLERVSLRGKHFFIIFFLVLYDHSEIWKWNT